MGKKHLFMCENHSTSGPQPRQKGVLEIADVARLVASPEIGWGIQLDGRGFCSAIFGIQLSRIGNLKNGSGSKKISLTFFQNAVLPVRKSMFQMS